MEPKNVDVKIIPGCGIGWTGRDGKEYYVDLLDHDVREADPTFEGVETIGQIHWNIVGLPDRAKKD